MNEFHSAALVLSVLWVGLNVGFLGVQKKPSGWILMVIFLMFVCPIVLLLASFY